MKKSLIVLYGIIAYMIFLVTFLYAIGFLGNFIVPKSVDSGIGGDLLNSIVIDIILLSVFALQHSIMARPSFKSWWIGKIGAPAERSTYVLFSSLALILIYWQWQPIPTIVWEVDNEIVSSIIMGVYFTGWAIVLLSTFMINHFELFGLKQVFASFRERQPEPHSFQVNFLYKMVRHPIMLGFLIAFWATPVMTVGHFLFSIVTTAYIIVAVKYLEEKDLRKSLGKEYEDYQDRVPMFFPLIKLKRKSQIEPDLNE